MLNAIETYLALRRATGFAMSTAECLLKSFAAFAAERGQTHVVSQTAIDWAALGPTVAQRDARLRAVCRFVRHVQVEDVGHTLPPANHFGACNRRRTPHIYTTDEIGRLIEAALRLRPMRGLRANVARAVSPGVQIRGQQRIESFPQKACERPTHDLFVQTPRHYVPTQSDLRFSVRAHAWTSPRMVDTQLRV